MNYIVRNAVVSELKEELGKKYRIEVKLSEVTGEEEIRVIHPKPYHFILWVKANANVKNILTEVRCLIDQVRKWERTHEDSL